MKSLFYETTLGGIKLKNRFVRAATWENMADGRRHLTERLRKVYENLAQDGVGLIITGYASIIEDAQPNSGMIGIFNDRFMPEFSELTERVHSLGSKIILQIAHGGSQTGDDPAKRTVWGPSAVPHKS